jgi:DNA-directed RNA polymerase subunit A"
VLAELATIIHIIDYAGKMVVAVSIPMEHRKELLRCVEPGEQIGIRLAHHALSEATQSSLSAFHNAGLGSGVTSRASPSLQQIMDGAINQSNTSMIVKMNGKMENAIVYRPLRYYVDNVTNSIANRSLNGSDFWYTIGRNLGVIPEYKRKERSTIFRFHLNYRKLVDDFVTLKHLIAIFDGYIAFHSPDFISIIDVHLEDDAQISGTMELLERRIGVRGISSCNLADNMTLITTGSNLGEVLNMRGINNTETVSNNVYDVEKNFGVDAAREVLYDEILAKVNNVHTAALMADFMTCKGYVAPFKKDNPMLKARGFLSSIAFERPKSDIKGVVRNKIVDDTRSVYSQVITGQLPDVGSGSRLFSLEESDELDWAME